MADDHIRALFDSLNGWQRIGVVTSTVWTAVWIMTFFCWSIGAGMDAHDRCSKPLLAQQKLALDQCKDIACIDAVKIPDFKPCSEAYESAVRAWYSIDDLQLLFVVVTFPIALLWLFGVLCFHSVRWIIDGFRRVDQ